VERSELGFVGADVAPGVEFEAYCELRNPAIVNFLVGWRDGGVQTASVPHLTCFLGF
jgi:hypothetical protein